MAVTVGYQTPGGDFVPVTSINPLPIGGLSSRSGSEAASTATPTANVVALTAAALVKSGSTRVVTYNIQNPNPAAVFVQFFNAASAGAVTLGTTVPLNWLAIPAGGVLDGAWATSEPYNAGLVIAATTTPNGATVASTGLPVSLGVV
jgi:hypothetical protein